MFFASPLRIGFQGLFQSNPIFLTLMGLKISRCPGQFSYNKIALWDSLLIIISLILLNSIILNLTPECGSTLSTHPSQVRDLPGIVSNDSTASRCTGDLDSCSFRIFQMCHHVSEDSSSFRIFQTCHLVSDGIEEGSTVLQYFCVHTREDLQAADPFSTDVILESSFQQALNARPPLVKVQLHSTFAKEPQRESHSSTYSQINSRIRKYLSFQMEAKNRPIRSASLWFFSGFEGVYWDH